MKTSFFILSLLLGCVPYCGSCDFECPPEPTNTFKKTYGSKLSDFGESVKQTPDGGYILLSDDFQGANLSDIKVTKTDANGALQWEKTFNESDTDLGREILLTADGGYLFVGDLKTPKGDKDILLVKLDKLGNALWKKTFDGSANDTGGSIVQTSDGGYIIVGVANHSGVINPGTLLIKIDKDGNQIWQSIFGKGEGEHGRKIQQTTEGGYIATGEKMVNGEWNVYLAKTDSQGNPLWRKNYGGDKADIGRAILTTTDGGYIIVGSTASKGAGSSDVWLIKTDGNGTVLWDKTFGGAQYDEGRDIRRTSDGGYVIAGETQSEGAGGSDVLLLKTDDKGNLLWKKTFGGAQNDAAWHLQLTSDGGYVLIGYTESEGAGGSDVYVIKTDSDGNVF